MLHRVYLIIASVTGQDDWGSSSASNDHVIAGNICFRARWHLSGMDCLGFGAMCHPAGMDCLGFRARGQRSGMARLGFRARRDLSGMDCQSASRAQGSLLAPSTSMAGAASLLRSALGFADKTLKPVLEACPLAAMTRATLHVETRVSRVLIFSGVWHSNTESLTNSYIRIQMLSMRLLHRVA